MLVAWGRVSEGQRGFLQELVSCPGTFWGRHVPAMAPREQFE